jgi:hypothetical protein
VHIGHRSVAVLAGILLAGVGLAAPAPVDARLPTTPTVDHDKNPYAREMTLIFYAIPDPDDTRVVWISCDGGATESEPYPFADRVLVSLDLPGCEGYGVKTVDVQVEEADGTPVFWGQVHPGISPRLTIVRPLEAITGQPYTFDPEWPDDYALPDGSLCRYEFRWGNDRSLLENEHDETFGALGFDRKAVDGECPTWTFTLPWVPYPQFELHLDVGEVEPDGGTGWWGRAYVRFDAELEGTNRRISASNLPIAQILPDTYTPIVGRPITYTRYLIGGATAGTSDWTAWQGSDPDLNHWHQTNGSTFTITPWETGNITVGWQRRGERLFYAMYDPPVRRPDRTDPTATTPVQRVGSGTVGATVPVRITWDGSDVGWGIARFQLERSVDGGAWRRILSAKVRSSAQALTPGHRYRYRVRAVDKAGNVGSWRTAAAFRPVVREDGSSAAAYRGEWLVVEDVTARGGTLREASSSAAVARFEFTGRDVAWIAERGPGHGRAAVFVDGRRVETVDLTAAGDQAARVVFRRHWGERGTHRIRIEVLGTVGRPVVGIDGFVVLR